MMRYVNGSGPGIPLPVAGRDRFEAMSEDSLKIVLVHNTYQQPGGEDVVFEQERKMLEAAGHAVIPYCRSNWDVDTYRGLRLVNLAARTVWASDSRREFWRLLRQEKPDLVHVHNTFVMISPSIYSVCFEENVPVVQTLHKSATVERALYNHVRSSTGAGPVRSPSRFIPRVSSMRPEKLRGRSVSIYTPMVLD